MSDLDKVVVTKPNEKYSLLLANYKRGVAFELGFSYDSDVSNFMLAYGLYKTLLDMNSPVMPSLDDLLTHQLGLMLEDDLSSYSLGYDSVRETVIVTEYICTCPENQIHISSNFPIRIPYAYYELNGVRNYIYFQLFDEKHLIADLKYSLASESVEKFPPRTKPIDVRIDDVIRINGLRRNEMENVNKMFPEIAIGDWGKYGDIEWGTGYVTSEEDLFKVHPTFKDYTGVKHDHSND